MAKQIDTNWFLPNGNNKYKEGGRVAAKKVRELNAEKWAIVAEESGKTPEQLENIFAGHFESARNKIIKNGGKVDNQSIIESILNTRTFTTEEEMAFAKIRKILTNSNHWLKFLKENNIKADKYDTSLWSYDKTTQKFIYDGRITVYLGDNYYNDLTIGTVDEDEEGNMFEVRYEGKGDDYEAGLWFGEI